MTDNDVVEAHIAPAETFSPPKTYNDSDTGPMVRWAISFDCVIGFANDPNIGLHVFTSMSRGGYEQRSVTPNQLRDFACRLIELAATARRDNDQ